MAKRVPIKPGCLCLVVGKYAPLPGTVEVGDIVTAVEYLGTLHGILGGELVTVRDAWGISNARIEARRKQVSRNKDVAVAARCLQPISDPDQDITIWLEQAEELIKEVTGIPSK